MVSDVCQKTTYATDAGLFFRYLEVMKTVVAGNASYYENVETCTALNDVVFRAFARLFSFLPTTEFGIPQIQNTLHALLEVAFALPIRLERPTTVLLRGPTFLDTYYKILKLVLKTRQGEEALIRYVVGPLEALGESLYNACQVSRVGWTLRG